MTPDLLIHPTPNSARGIGPVPPRAPRRGSGFVLPICILLVVMVGAVAAIMLERHVARAKTVQRQFEAYQEHHGVRSLQTVIQAWRKTPSAQPRDLADMLEEDGLAFTVEPGNNSRIEVYLFPGQDTMLKRIGSLSGEEREAAGRVMNVLRARVRTEAELESYLRPAGPLQVDVNQASPVLLESIVSGVIGDGPQGTAYSRALVDARLRGEPIGLQTLTNIASESGLEPEQRTLLNRFFTVSPEVWRFRVDLRAASATSTALLSQYGGLIQLGSTTSVANSAFEEPTPFLTWERLNPDDPRAVE